MAQDKLCMVEAEKLIPTNDNPRIIDTKSAEFRELVESVRSVGVLIPVHARPYPKREGKYDLRAGERRVLASKAAGVKKVPTIVHSGMDDEQAFELTFTENFARQDLAPLEEGKAAETLLTRFGGDARAAAAKMGKSLSWLLQRVAINKNLSRTWRQVVEAAAGADGDYSHWTAAHLQLIARLPVDIQDELLDRVDPWEAPLWSVAELDTFVTEHFRLLKNVPWDTADATLVKDVGACDKCPKRSSASPGLFDDTTEPAELAKTDRCLDADCFDAKMSAWARLRLAELRAEYHSVVCISTASPDYMRQRKLADKFESMMYGYKICNKSAKEAVAALVVEGPGIGELRWVRPTKDVVGEPASRKATAGAAGGKKSLKEKREMLDRKRWSEVVKTVRDAVEKAEIEQIANGDRIRMVLAIAIEFGTTVDYTRDSEGWETVSGLLGLGVEGLLAELWRNLRRTLADELTYTGPITQIGDERIADARSVAALLGMDIDAIFEEVARTEYPEPKSWAKEKGK